MHSTFKVGHFYMGSGFFYWSLIKDSAANKKSLTPSINVNVRKLSYEQSDKEKTYGAGQNSGGR